MNHFVDQTVVATIAAEVASIIPHDQIEQDHKQDVCEWLKSSADPFRLQKPDIPPKHLVSYFVLVDADHRSMLLVDHIKAQLWLPSGGHVELNELPRAAAVREAKEEFGIQVQYDRSEFTDVEWYTFDEILQTDPHIFDPHLQRFTAKLADYV